MMHKEGSSNASVKLKHVHEWFILELSKKVLCERVMFKLRFK